jgi:hypothetical protein
MMMIGLLSMAGLTACTDDDPPPQQTTTAPTASSTATPSPTLTPPTAPKPRPTPKNAEAFVKYFWDVYNYSYASLDPEPLRAMSKPTCKFCAGSIREIEKSRNERLTNEGGRLTPLVVAAPPGKIHDHVVVSSVLRQDAGRLLGPNREVLHTSKALSAVETKARLEWRSGKWVIAAINITQGDK